MSHDYRYAWRNGWRWVGWDLRDRRPMAALRQAFWRFVRGYISETCERCGRPYMLWHADDDLWCRVTGYAPGIGMPSAGLYCPACFDHRADMLGLVLKWNPTVIRDHSSEGVPSQHGAVAIPGLPNALATTVLTTTNHSETVR